MLLRSFNETEIKRARWLLLLPPCLPGLLMLFLGSIRTPLLAIPDATNAAGDHYSTAKQQSDILLDAGSVALMGGLAMSGFIAWKIVRPPPTDEEEEPDTSSQT